MSKKVLISHYRIGRTDGVSLEIEKRKSVMERLGWRVFLVSGPVNAKADYIIEELEFDSQENRRIKQNSFARLADFSSGTELVEYVERISARIFHQLLAIVKSEAPDFLMLHNIFSHGRHIAAAKAFHDCIEATGIPALATHHDFYWERPEYRRITCREAREYIDRYIPCRHPLIRHAVINTSARNSLREKKGIEAVIIPDTFDFAGPPWQVDDYNADFPDAVRTASGDIILLQATRIVERKGIEITIELARTLNRPPFLDRLQNKTLFNGKKTDSPSRVILIVAGYAEQDANKYLDHLKEVSRKAGIEVRFIGDRIRAQREQNGQRGQPGKKIYSLWDCYVFADVVAYPSLMEGWGNQFIEAVFAKKPIVLFEYPVFQSDIKPLGYDCISLGTEAVKDPELGLYSVPRERMQAAAGRLVEVLCSRETPKMLNRNFRIGETHNSFGLLETLLRKCVEKQDDQSLSK